MFDPPFAEIYDTVYNGRGKRFAAEAADVASLVRERSPGAATLLDVGCGTGEHLASLRGAFRRVEGLEPAPAMRLLARRKLPDVPVHAGDMRDFDLGRTFDAVTCLFCAVAYLGSQAELYAAAERMAGHLGRGGVLVVEPWWFPERFVEGYVAGDVVREEDRTIARVSHSTRDGDATRLEMHHLVATAGGVEHVVEVHRLTLFERGDYEGALRAAGCRGEYVERDGWPRGLFVGVRSG